VSRWLQIVLESNKCVVSRHGTFIGKGYDCRGLLCLSLLDVRNKVVNIANISDESDLWHSHLCHVNFGCLMRLANLNLISKINMVKSSKCHVCVIEATSQASQGCGGEKFGTSRTCSFGFIRNE
jgi:hypothetical protein